MSFRLLTWEIFGPNFFLTPYDSLLVFLLLIKQYLAIYLSMESFISLNLLLFDGLCRILNVFNVYILPSNNNMPLQLTLYSFSYNNFIRYSSIFNPPILSVTLVHFTSAHSTFKYNCIIFL